MPRTNYIKEFKHLYGPSSREAALVDVPPINYIILEGCGDSCPLPDFFNSIEAMIALSCLVRLLIKKGSPAADYSVMPLEVMRGSGPPGAILRQRGRHGKNTPFYGGEPF